MTALFYKKCKLIRLSPMAEGIQIPLLSAKVNWNRPGIGFADEI